MIGNAAENISELCLRTYTGDRPVLSICGDWEGCFLEGILQLWKIEMHNQNPDVYDKP